MADKSAASRAFTPQRVYAAIDKKSINRPQAFIPQAMVQSLELGQMTVTPLKQANFRGLHCPVLLLFPIFSGG
jgi:hypothetical protein